MINDEHDEFEFERLRRIYYQWSVYNGFGRDIVAAGAHPWWELDCHLPNYPFQLALDDDVECEDVIDMLNSVLGSINGKWTYSIHAIFHLQEFNDFLILKMALGSEANVVKEAA